MSDESIVSFTAESAGTSASMAAARVVTPSLRKIAWT